MASAAEQAFTQLQTELHATRAHVVQISAAHDALKAAHDALNAASHRLFGERETQIRESEEKLKNLIFTQKFDLIDFKDLKPDQFKGRKTEAFKPWAKKLKAYCNNKRSGFRKALEWAESQTSEIRDTTGSGWGEAAAADVRLHDFLLSVLAEDAALLVDHPPSSRAVASKPGVSSSRGTTQAVGRTSWTR